MVQPSPKGLRRAPPGLGHQTRSPRARLCHDASSGWSVRDVLDQEEHTYPGVKYHVYAAPCKTRAEKQPGRLLHEAKRKIIEYEKAHENREVEICP